LRIAAALDAGVEIYPTITRVAMSAIVTADAKSLRRTSLSGSCTTAQDRHNFVQGGAVSAPNPVFQRCPIRIHWRGRVATIQLVAYRPFDPRVASWLGLNPNMIAV